MPINPGYNFLDPKANLYDKNQFLNVDASLEDKNQFLDFLRRDAMQKGMGANYIADIGNTQETMNVLGAPAAPAPVQPAPMPKAPVKQPATRPVAPVTREYVDNIPLADRLVSEQTIENKTPEFSTEPMIEGPIAPQRPVPEIPESFDRTTLANKAREMGFDPRQLFVALSEFSAGMGNIKGKPTASTARSFYEMQKKYEDAQAGRDQAMTLAAMRMRQPEVKAVDPLTEQYKQAQIDYLKSKMQPKPMLQAPPQDPLKKKLMEEQIALTKARREALGGTAPQAVGGEDVQAQKPSGAYGEKIQVPGWRKAQNVPADKTELKQFRDRSSKVPRVIEKINQLKDMIRRHGAFENPYNEAGTMMRQLSNDIKLDLKGPEFKALGVLAGPDMAILEALIPDTSNPGNALRGDASVTRSLDMLSENLQKDIDAAARQLGFEREGTTDQETLTGARGFKVWKP